jgi:hypothetical protein
MDRWTYDGWAWEASSDRRLDARARSEGRSPSYLTKRYTKLLHNFMIQLATRKLWADIFMVYSGLWRLRHGIAYTNLTCKRDLHITCPSPTCAKSPLPPELRCLKVIPSKSVEVSSACTNKRGHGPLRSGLTSGANFQLENARTMLDQSCRLNSRTSLVGSTLCSGGNLSLINCGSRFVAPRPRFLATTTLLNSDA